MKKIILSAFIAFSIVSCSSENDSPGNISAQDSNKVIASFGDSFLEPTKTGKPVERGSIPVAINQITVTAENINNVIPIGTTIFDLVGNGTSNPTQFLLDGVSAGTNTFTATANTTASPVNVAQTVADATAQSLFASYKTDVPYAFYTATTSKVVNFNSPQVIPFAMATLNGRLNTYIYTGPTITAANMKVTVTRQRFKSDASAIDATAKTFDLTGTQSLISSWSDADSVDDNYVHLTIDVYDADGTTVVYSDTRDITVSPYTTINTTIAITNTGITTSTNQAIFSFPDWISVDQ